MRGASASPAPSRSRDGFEKGMGMVRSMVGAALLATMLPLAPAAAQTASATAPAPDPARLAVARTLIDRFLPPDRRDAMVEQMIRPMAENARDAVFAAPSFAEMRAENPEFVAKMNGFMAEEFERTIAMTKAAMPEMLEAMARAYARRFTLAQLEAIDGFFQTPAGRAYAEQAPAIMTDPDVLAAQRKMMTEAMAAMEERLGALVTTVEDAAKAKAAKPAKKRE